MDGISRRSLVGAVGATGVVLALGRKVFAQGAGRPGSMRGAYSDLANECIKACSDCHIECVSAIEYCLEVGGDHVRPDHVRRLQTCSEMCIVAAHFMLSRSEFDKKQCGLCEESCRKCADSCGRFTDDVMQRCVKMCRDCAEVCKRYVAS